MHYRRENGLPRRFAPRNDMLKTATRLRLQGTGAAIRIPWQKRGTLHPCPGSHIPTKPVIANQCAHWCGNPRPRRETWQLGTTSGKFVCIFPYSPKVLLLVLHCRKEYGLPRRFAPRNDRGKGDADCHVASLLAMTCRNMHLCAYATKWCHGKFMGLTYLPLGTALRHAPPQELRSVPSLRSLQWQKEGGLGLSRQ